MNNKWMASCFVLVLAVLSVGAVAAAPAAGETYVYRVSNGYNHLALGTIQYRVDKVEPDRVAVSVSTDVPALGGARTEIYNKDGNWLRHAVTSRDAPVDYEFAQPYVAYAFPLDPGKSWSVRVNASIPATSQKASVRVDGEVVGSERINVPAGAFDTIKIKRRAYAGDWGAFTMETHIEETEWYAPALGRAVRSESRSSYVDSSRSRSGSLISGNQMLGDWNVFELANITKQ
jgi:hypothetical protein